MDFKMNKILSLILFVFSLSASAQTVATNGSETSKLIAKIPFEIYHGSIVLHVKLNDNPRTLRMLFDTGADGMAVSQALADSLGLKSSRSQKASVVGGNIEISISEGNNVNLGNFSLKNQSIAFFKEMGKDLDGLIGNTMTRKYVTKVDFDHQELSLYDFENYQYEKGGSVVPITIPNGLFIIPGNVAIRADKPYQGNFVFDTGASYHLICFRPFVKQNRLLVDGFKSEYMASTVSMGISSPTFGGKAASFSFSNSASISNFPITLMAGGGQNESWTPGFDGSIGMKIISKYNFTINRQKNEIYLVPNKTAHHPVDFILKGYVFGFNADGKLEIQNLGAPANKNLKIGDVGTVKTINNIPYQTLLKDPKQLKKLTEQASESTFSLAYEIDGKIIKETI